ncbi:HAD-like protein [Thelephora terrestris]|uniref:Mitochondrial import inner membrane translocase subunit TIM50 n=1 Tax=Thelephora terrestris TaxID=56493 RepID=A0A9P6HEU6_9AGAM|nr:HAD-like protein [Thelephora terrestris]
MLVARLAAQLPARRALVQYPIHARTFASKKSKRPQQDPSGSQPAASSQSSSEPSKQHPNVDPSAPEQAPAAPGDISDSKLSDLPSLSTLDFTAADETPRSERTGARSAKDSPSSIERKTRHMSKLMIGIAALGLGVYAASLGGEWTEAELKEKRMTLETAPSTRWGRTVERASGVFDLFTKPIWTELLPPPLPAPHQKPYTLVLSLDDLLVTSTWDRQYGWRTAKRPGVDYFLAYLSQFYEVVIFTTQHNYTGCLALTHDHQTAAPIVEKLDPYGFHVAYKLFRDATKSENGRPVKDLSYLNRDLSKVILLDTDPDHCTTHPDNSLVIPKWKGTPGDRGLVAMIPFLESIAIYRPPDVRPILKAFHGKDVPVEYAKQEAEAKKRHIEAWQQSGAKRLSESGFTLSSMFGSTSTPSKSPVPPTYLEQKRAEAQALYKEEQAYIAANKENFERLLEEDRQAMAKEMSGNALGVVQSMFLGKKPEPSENATVAGADVSTPEKV